MPTLENEPTRKERRDKKIEGKLTAEAKSYGANIDPSLDIGVQSKERIADLNEQIAQGAEDDEREKMKKFQDSISSTRPEPTPQIDMEHLKDNYKRQRVTRWTDAMVAFGEGMQGRRVDPNSTYSARLANERKEMYAGYKQSFAEGKKNLAAWENNYINQQINYLKELKGQKKNAAEIAQIDARIELLEAQKTATLAGARTQEEIDAGIERTKAQTKAYGAQAESTALRAQTDAEAKAEAAKNKNKNTDTISQRTGDTTTTKKVSKEISDLHSTKQLELKQLQEDKKNLESKMQDEYYGIQTSMWGKSKIAQQKEIRDKYNDKLDEIDESIKAVNLEIKDIFDKAPSDAQENVSGEEGDIDPWDL